VDEGLRAQGVEKIQPYEHLSDAELHELTGEAADLQLRMSQLVAGEVAARMNEHGCPLLAAHRTVKHPLLAPSCYRFYLDCEDAERGDPEAKARVEIMERGWEALRSRGAPTTLEGARSAEGLA
jgi:hypothetical protein